MLYDVDKFSEDRGSPNPNTADTLITGAVKAHGTHSVNYTTDATNLSTIQAAKNGQFTIIQAGTFTATATSYSPAPAPGVPVNTTITLGVIAHGLGFKPGIIPYMAIPSIDSNTRYPLPYYSYSGTGTSGLWERWWCSVDVTNVSFFYDAMDIGFASVSNGPRVFKYYLTQQTAADS